MEDMIMEPESEIETMQGSIDTIGEMNFTMFTFISRKYYKLGSLVELPDGMVCMVSHVESFVEQEEVYYEYIVREKAGIVARYQNNPHLAGVSLLGTIKKRIGNTVSINLDIDKDDGYKSGQKDYFFAYALETKDYYCMPVEGARVHLHFPTGKEWEAIAINSLRMENDHSAQRASKISNPDNRSLSNDSGVSLDMTPDHINFTPHDDNAVFVKLEKSGDITVEGTKITLNSKEINIGKAAMSSIVEKGAEEVTCKNLSMSAKNVIYIARCTGGEEPVPIEDHFIGLNEYAQLHSTEKIKHITNGPFRAPSVSYDESALREQEQKQIDEQNDAVKNTLVERKKAAMGKIGKGLLMAALGVAAVVATVATGGAALAVIGAAAVGTGLVAFGAANIQEGVTSGKLADSGDWSTPADNYLKNVIPDPYYGLIENGLIIAGSIITGGCLGIAAADILGAAAINTGISMIFDLADNGRLDRGPMDYLDEFSTSCMITALTGGIGKKLGKCDGNFAQRFMGRFPQQMAASSMYNLMSGDLDLKNLGENGIRELLSAMASSAIPVNSQWAKNLGKNLKYVQGAVDTFSDGLIDTIMQGIEMKLNPGQKFDNKRLFQTVLRSAINNFRFSCDPVNCVRGNLYALRVDLSYEDLYDEFTFQRRYDSVLDVHGTMGYGWGHEYESRLIPEGTRVMNVLMPDSHMETFLRQEDNTWLNKNSKTRIYELLFDYSDRRFFLVSREGGKYRKYGYNQDGLLSEIWYDQFAVRRASIQYREKPADGSKEQYKNTEIDSITSPGGKVLHFTYENNLLTRIADDFGREVVYEYQDGCLVKANYPSQGSKSYQYNGQHKLVTMSGEDGRDFITNEYDIKGRVIRQNYPDHNFCKILYDDKNRVSTFAFSDSGRLVKEIDGDNYQKGTTDEERPGTLYQYNAAGYLLEKREPVSMEGNQIRYRLTAFEYDLAGNRTKERRSNDYVTKTGYPANYLDISFFYDARNRLVKVTDSLGAAMEYTYDCLNNRTSEKARINETKYRIRYFSYDACGRLEEVKEVIDREDLGLEEKTSVKQELAITRYTYDRNGNVTRITTPEGYHIDRTYDVMDRLTEEVFHDDTHGIHKKEGYEYDGNGNQISLTDGLGYSETWEYNKEDKVVTKTDKAGHTVRLVYNRNGAVIKEIKGEENQETSYTYDGFGRIVSVRNALGYLEQQNETRYLLDEWGRITGIQKPDGSTESYTYDYAGNITSTTDGNGGTITYEYNTLNQLSKITDQEGNAETFFYDKQGRSTRHVDRDGRTVRYQFNGLGALVWKQGDQESERYDYQYDQEGRLTEAVGGGVRYGYDYMPDGQLKTKYRNGRTALEYSYNSLGKVAGIRDISGKQASYQYDGIGRLMSVSDHGKRLVSYEYHKDNNLAIARFANGVVTEYQYDRDKNVQELTTKQPDGTVLLACSYEYDRNGNRTHIFGKQEGREHNTVYGYDSMQRLAKVQYPDGGTEQFGYDKAGNRSERLTGSWKETYEYDVRNRLTRRSGVEKEKSIITLYEYDKQGNTLMEKQFLEGVGETGRTSYEYNGFLKTSKVTVEQFENDTMQNVQVQENFYDAENFRYGIIEDGKQTDFISNGWDVFTELDGEEKVTNRLVRAYGIVASEQEVQSGKLEYFYYHGDEHNDIRYITGEDGNVRNRYGYEQVEKLFDDVGTVPGESSSKNLGKNINGHVGITGNHKTGSHQAQHLIPQEVFENSAYLQSLGFNVDHHQNGIWDKNKNKNSTVLNELYKKNNVSSSMQERYISENTHHNGYHKLYSQAVNTEVNKIQADIEAMRKTGNYSESQLKRIGRQKVNELVQSLRIMNQDGIDLYKQHSSYADGTDYTNKTSEYNEMFSEKLSNAKKKANSKCGK